MQAIYFDVTDIVQHAMKNTHVTGIQRSVLKIIESVVRNRTHPVFGLVKHPLNGGLFTADLSFMKGQYDLTDFCTRFDLPSGKRLWLAGKLLRYKRTPLRRAHHYLRLQLRWKLSPRLRANYRPSPAKASCLLGEAKLARGSAIVVLGAGWATSYVEITNLAKAYDCTVAYFVHDIIALLMPDQTAFFARDKNQRFEKWLSYVAAHASLLICNSDFTRQTLQDYLQSCGLQAKIKVAKFPHEFKCSSSKENQTIREEVSQITRRDYVLCIGTIEVRKNIVKLLECWRKLSKIYGANLPELVLAGSKGWGVDDVYKILKRTSNVGDTVKVVYGPDDAELELLYLHCRFTVFPSLFEGWGLPIGESLWFGKPVICANNASMPEVGEAFATYFDHAQPNSLLEALENMINQPVTLPQNIRKHLRTWDATAESLIQAVENYARPTLDLERSALPITPL